MTQGEYLITKLKEMGLRIDIGVHVGFFSDHETIIIEGHSDASPPYLVLEMKANKKWFETKISEDNYLYENVAKIMRNPKVLSSVTPQEPNTWSLDDAREDFYDFENNDIENVDAWMPLPEPYKAESEG